MYYNSILDMNAQWQGKLKVTFTNHRAYESQPNKYNFLDF